jgi:hypothetical protein
MRYPYYDVLFVRLDSGEHETTVWKNKKEENLISHRLFVVIYLAPPNSGIVTEAPSYTVEQLRGGIPAASASSSS